ncbi:RNA polymerase sigma-70 factor [Pedobacter sp. MC2016-14]|uniref:RNA polymerase sigma factor n=1 Tax=Pedobacter sp. MC2016-14 TaxID=2897327 RepID=UPI001E2BEF52|nr:RNA polymerase sigma-70 factor [Pedobacter sp. MC2016-14]MCD0487591.1 RNA polymerase sigma-70 factor [Pedobacter sp. MC2016-14]
MAIKPLFDEVELPGKLAAGDAAAFKFVYQKFNKKIYTVTLSILKSAVLAEEITQEVFLKLWQHNQQFNDIDHLEAWLRTAARNQSLNAFRKIVLERKMNQHNERNFSEGHNETEEAILLHDTRRLLDDAVSKLPAQQREIYTLCHQQGLKYEEVAAQMNISVNTVKTHMKRALATLRIYMKDRGDIAALIILFKIF